MAAKPRLSFLTVFVTLLTLGFSVAVALRVRSYTAVQEVASPPASVRPAGARASVTAVPQPQAGGELTTIVPAPADMSRTPETSAAARALAREQRYRELLAISSAGPPSATQAARQQKTEVRIPPAAKPQSPAGRPQPVVNAVTGSKPSSQPPPVQHPTARPEDPPKSATRDDSDPNSDTVPPQLISIEFIPPQVHDGEETLLAITAVDNLSGIRGISGTLTSPTGKALQGFAQQREGETNRYVSRITIPKDAEEGTWRISFLNLSDNATNMATLTYAQGTIPPSAVLRVVSSRSDSSPPTLRAVSLARRGMRTNEPNTLFIEAQDDKSGVRLVAAVFVSPSKLARLGFGCKHGEGDVWECTISPPQCLDCGEWQLEQIQMQDNANNYATIRQDNPLVNAVRLNITGDTCDSIPPVIHGVVLDKDAVIIGQGDPAVTVRVQVSDDLCGVGGMSGQVAGPGTNAGTFFAFTPEGGDGNLWVGTIRLNANAPRGVWRVQSITVNDKGQNIRIYYASDPLLGRAQFVVK